MIIGQLFNFIRHLENYADSLLSFIKLYQLKAKGSRSEIQVIKEYGHLSAVECYPIKGHKNSVVNVVFSPDGKLLASASNDNSIIVQ